MGLNEGQLEAYENIKGFLDDEESLISAVTLVGPPGAGKSFLLGKILDGVEYIAAAPSWKAAAVLTESIGQQVITVASLLGIKLNEKTGKFVADRNPDSQNALKGVKLVVIDEVSMMSNDLIQLLFDKKADNCKVIFSGDLSQLPFVGAKPGEVTKAFTEFPVFELTEVMRQKKGSNIGPLLDVIRGAINGDNDLEIERESKNDLRFHEEPRDFLNEFIRDYKDNPKGTRIMTYNNENSANPFSVKTLNDMISNKLYGLKTDVYHKGSQLMSYGSFDVKNPKDHKKSLGRIFNSVDYTIVEVGRVRKSTKDIKAWIMDPRSGQSGEKTTPITIEVQSLTLSCNIKQDEVFEVEVPTMTEAGYGKYHEIIKKAFTVSEFQFGYKLMEAFPNFRYAFAISCHKSQGSTYENAYVCTNNVMEQPSVSFIDKMKAIYVAASRPKNKLVIL